MRLLVAAEGVTLAHSARVATLAAGLAARGHDVVAVGVDTLARFDHPQVRWRELWCIGPARFGKALASGLPPYRAVDLKRYLADERRLIDETQPDAVIADFRPTLAMSARAMGVPGASLINAYWSPAAQGRLPMPVLPGTALGPMKLAQTLYDIGSKVVLPMHCRPWNKARQSMGQASLGPQLRALYCDADEVLYADVPGMFDLAPLPPRHHFIGPLLWSPHLTDPPWWRDVDTTLPAAYVSLGSSGSAKVLGRVVEALASQPMSLMVSSVGQQAVDALVSQRTHVAPYLNGRTASHRADIVICNGGSMSCQQAFAFGKPVLGIASNMDQFLNMQGVVAAGAGICLRADRVDEKSVRRAVQSLLTEPSYAITARAIGERQAQYNPIALVDAILREAVKR